MARDELGHLEHGHLALAAKQRLKLVVGQNIALIGRVLEVVLLDVLPHLLNDLTAGHRSLADDRLKLGVELQRLHEGCICCSRHDYSLCVKGRSLLYPSLGIARRVGSRGGESRPGAFSC